MEKFVLMLFLCHVSSSVRHSLEFFCVGSFGIPNFPGFFGTVEVNGIQLAYCDSNGTIKPKQHWVETLMQTDPDHVDWYKTECFDIQPGVFKDRIHHLMQSFNQTEGVHVLQRISGCEWDDETGDIKGFIKYGYDGEDILSFDINNPTWIALKPEADDLKLIWNNEKPGQKFYEFYLTKVFPEWLKKYVEAGKSSLLRTDLPSVSLLQKSPSSPVTCFATGFYPNSTKLFWRKDGEELHEDVEHGEILPNQDGSFQRSVDVNISSVTPEDWWKYECVFLLSGVKEEIITELHWIRLPDTDPTMFAVAVSVGATVIVLVAAVVGFMFYRRYKDPKTRTKESGTLNLETTSMNSQSCSRQQHNNNQEEETLNTEQVK